MARRGRPGVLIGVLLLLAGCAIAPRSSFTLDSAFRTEAWTKVAVLPFGGPPAYSRPAAEYFAFRLRGQPHFKIVDPATAEMTARRGGVPLPPAGEEVPMSEVTRVAALTGANAVFLGSVMVLQPAQPVTAIEVKLVDAGTLHVVATSRESSLERAPLALSEHKRVMMTIDEVANRMLAAMDTVAGHPTGAERHQ